MSDAGQEPREWRFYVNDMIKFAEKVQLFTGSAARKRDAPSSPLREIPGIPNGHSPLPKTTSASVTGLPCLIRKSSTT